MRTLYTLAFPTLSEPDALFVEEIRRAHDPLHHAKVAAHFTLVFGCDAIPESEYIEHVRGVAQSTSAVPFVCRYAMLGADDLDQTAYVFLVPDEGFSGLSLLHDKLYRGALAPHHRLDIPYVPHITVGRNNDRMAAKGVCDRLNRQGVTLRGTVGEMTVCALDGVRVERLDTFRLG